ncbi:NAD(P)-dependent oxidoreductase [Rossellomorea vietnamensis]|uniref:NAD(P)-dependent oxidoreductase n=1 Tax=Rossellomorea vietnamensis TaxID=218284 RepID=UPI001CCFB836|nr:NAD(P)-dependent oxidoreductase [Rossellomorea vietnamensis]MCA0150437.1 NAD(P)-dependent oxidoreductase [Rossellomorea vietnamensis]
MKIGFIGLGKMGSGLAKNLIRAGYEVILYDINPEAVKSVLKTGGRSATSPKEAASGTDAVFTSLPLPDHLIQLLIEGEKLLEDMRPGAVLIDVSTIDPSTARRIAAEAEAHHVKFLACPLGKGPAQAEEGTEPIFVGGEKEVYEAYKSMLEKIGQPVTYLGGVEQSTAFKLISNMVGMTNLAAVSEGFHLAVESGIDPTLFKELMHDTGADSAQLKLRGSLMLNENYQPMFSVNLAEKDVRLGVKMAQENDTKAEFSQLALKYLQQAKIQYGNEDAAAIYRTFRQEFTVKR